VATTDVQPQKALTYRQLFANLSPSSPEAKIKAITDGYLKLRKHFEKPPEQMHMTTWPESLMELSPQELCKVFEEGQREEFCPTAGVLWKFAQRDRDAIRDAAFTEHWTMFLRMLKKHGPDWEPREYRIGERTDEHPAGSAIPHFLRRRLPWLDRERPPCWKIARRSHAFWRCKSWFRKGSYRTALSLMAGRLWLISLLSDLWACQWRRRGSSSRRSGRFL
jgi:hypothetical protein